MRRILGTLVLSSFLLSAFALPSCKSERKELKPITYIGSYNRDFNDLNDLHINAAQQIGIDPVSSREEAKKISRKLVEIETCDEYELDKLTHSIPFLVPEAAKLIEEIGNNFNEQLKELNAPEYKIIVTSVTRTEKDVKKLKKRNGNASNNSAHLYGTTFDVSWVRFKKIDESDTLNIPQDKLKMVLAGVLKDLRKQDRCYIKHERRQGCFHITARD
ncbi:MAG TPA: hypothetical protein DCF91_00870 [Porphyromonadaceae bacterium]|nr:hypothetical protein [Porphyromonadaceae bacterium]